MQRRRCAAELWTAQSDDLCWCGEEAIECPPEGLQLFSDLFSGTDLNKEDSALKDKQSVKNGVSQEDTAPDPERSEEGKHWSTGPALSQSKFLLLQEDGRQDLTGDSSEEQRSSREPSGL